MNAILQFVFAPIATLLLGFILGRRKSQADAQSVELQNADRVIRIYKEATDDVLGRCDELVLELRSAKDELRKSRNDNQELHRQNDSLLKQLRAMREENATLSARVRHLEVIFQVNAATPQLIPQTPTPGHDQTI